VTANTNLPFVVTWQRAIPARRAMLTRSELSASRPGSKQSQDPGPTALGIENATHLFGSRAILVEPPVLQFDAGQGRPERHKANFHLGIDCLIVLPIS
jgi:hypothetical protein